MTAIKPIGYKRLECMVKKQGYQLARVSGDHLIYSRRGSPRPLVIPMYESVPVFIIKNLMRTMGLDREIYFGMLEHC